MASEIRVDKINSLSGVGTVTLSPTGVDISGITTAATLKATTGIVTTLTATTGIVTTFVTNTAKVGAAVTISESGIEASGIGITCANINGAQIGGRRNLVINGAMLVAQRGTSSTTNGFGSVDRFQIRTTGVDEDPTHAQATLTSAPGPYREGHRKAYKVTNGNQTGGAGAGDRIVMMYKFEAQDIANSGWDYVKPESFITLQFWVKSSVAQNFYGHLLSSDGTQQSFPFETGTLTANTWKKVVLKIPGNSNLQFDSGSATNAIDDGLQIEWQMFRGTDFTGSVSLNSWATFDSAVRTPDNTSTWYTTNDAEFFVTGVQLEVGSQATPFEHRSFGEELALCQRYCYVIKMNTGDYSGFIGQATSADAGEVCSSFPVPMRDEPTYTGSATNCRFQAGNSSSQVQFSALSIYRVPIHRPVSIIGLRDTDIGSMTQGEALMLHAMANNGKMTFDAEI